MPRGVHCTQCKWFLSCAPPVMLSSGPLDTNNESHFIPQRQSGGVKGKALQNLPLLDLCSCCSPHGWHPSTRWKIIAFSAHSQTNTPCRHLGQLIGISLSANEPSSNALGLCWLLFILCCNRNWKPLRTSLQTAWKHFLASGRKTCRGEFNRDRKP